MIIGVDGFPVSGPRTGVGRYVAELVKALTPYSEVKVAMDRTGSHTDVSDLLERGVDIHYTTRLVDRLFWAAAGRGYWLPYDLKIGRVDAMVFTRYARFKMRQTVPELSFVYDFSFLHAPETINQGPEALLSNVPPLIERSDYVGVISHTMARECVAAYPHAREKMVVLEPGLSTSLVEAQPGDTRKRIRQLGLRPGFLLFVGSIEPRKNLLPLIEAVNALPPDLALDHPLVIAGGPGWRNERILEAIDASVRVTRLPPFIDDATLKSLYIHSAALVFPSRYEGFGLPLLEAMHLGTPVLCSDIPVFREVAQDAARYFDPDDPAGIADAILAFVDGGEEGRDRMIARGRDRAEAYSWDSSARRLVRTLEGDLEPPVLDPVASPSVASTTAPRRRQTRIAIVSTPRSGNTWFRHVLAKSFGLGSRAVHEPGEVPWADLPDDFVLQLHWRPEDDLRDRFDRHGFLVCTIARHPGDVLLSILRFVQSAEETYRWLLGEGGREDSIVGASPGSAAFADYVRSHRAKLLLDVTPSWAELPNTKLVRYEDLLDDPVASVQSAFARFAAEPRTIEAAVERSSLAHLRHEHNQRAFHFWRGEAGSWRRLLPDQIVSAISEMHSEAIAVGDYSVDRPEILDSTTADRNWYELDARGLREETAVLRERVASLEQRVVETMHELAEAQPVLADPSVRFVLEHDLGVRSLKVARVLKRLRDRIVGDT